MNFQIPDSEFSYTILSYTIPGVYNSSDKSAGHPELPSAVCEVEHEAAAAAAAELTRDDGASAAELRHDIACLGMPSGLAGPGQYSTPERTPGN